MHGYSSLPVNGEGDSDFMKDSICVHPKAYMITSFYSGWKVHSARLNFHWWLCGRIFQGMASCISNAAMHSSNSYSWSYHVNIHDKIVKP